MNICNNMNPIKKISIIYICLLLTFSCLGDDDIKRLVVEDAELLCRNDVSVVDTVSLSSIGDTNVVTYEEKEDVWRMFEESRKEALDDSCVRANSATFEWFRANGLKLKIYH